MKKKLITILTVAAICTGTAYADLTPIPFKHGKTLVMCHVVGSSDEDLLIRTLHHLGGGVAKSANCDETVIRKGVDGKSMCTCTKQKFIGAMVNTAVNDDPDKFCGLNISVKKGESKEETLIAVTKNNVLCPAEYEARCVEFVDKTSNSEPYRHLEFVVNLGKI